MDLGLVWLCSRRTGKAGNGIWRPVYSAGLHVLIHYEPLLLSSSLISPTDHTQHTITYGHEHHFSSFPTGRYYNPRPLPLPKFIQSTWTRTGFEQQDPFPLDFKVEKVWILGEINVQWNGIVILAKFFTLWEPEKSDIFMPNGGVMQWYNLIPDDFLYVSKSQILHSWPVLNILNAKPRIIIYYPSLLPLSLHYSAQYLTWQRVINNSSSMMTK